MKKKKFQVVKKVVNRE